MEEKKIVDIYKKTGALLEGHFLLSSGRHSAYYLQSALVLSHPVWKTKVCNALVEKIKDLRIENKINLVVSPAMGGIIVGSCVGEALNLQSIFLERVEGKFKLRRGFTITNSHNILIVEDVVTTGKSSLECIECVESHGGKVVAEAALVNRGGEGLKIGVPLVSLITMDIPTYDEESLPQSLKDIPIYSPGSRFGT